MEGERLVGRGAQAAGLELLDDPWVIGKFRWLTVKSRTWGELHKEWIKLVHQEPPCICPGNGLQV